MEEEEVTEQTGETSKEFRFEMRIDAKWAEHVRRVANLAATVGVIRDDRRGNLTAWVNYCLNIGEEWLKQLAKAKGII